MAADRESRLAYPPPRLLPPGRSPSGGCVAPPEIRGGRRPRGVLRQRRSDQQPLGHPRASSGRPAAFQPERPPLHALSRGPGDGGRRSGAKPRVAVPGAVAARDGAPPGAARVDGARPLARLRPSGRPGAPGGPGTDPAPIPRAAGGARDREALPRRDRRGRTHDLYREPVPDVDDDRGRPGRAPERRVGTRDRGRAAAALQRMARAEHHGRPALQGPRPPRRQRSPRPVENLLPLRGRHPRLRAFQVDGGGRAAVRRRVGQSEQPRDGAGYGVLAGRGGNAEKRQRPGHPGLARPARGRAPGPPRRGGGRGAGAAAASRTRSSGWAAPSAVSPLWTTAPS